MKRTFKTADEARQYGWTLAREGRQFDSILYDYLNNDQARAYELGWIAGDRAREEANARAELRMGC